LHVYLIQINNDGSVLKLLKRNFKLKNIILIFIVAFIALIAGTAIYVFHALGTSNIFKEDTVVIVPQNATVEQAIAAFNEHNALKPAWILKPILRLGMKLTGKNIHPGCHKFTNEASNMTIITGLLSGSTVHTIKATYPEGITLTKFASISARLIGIDSARFISAVYQDSIIKSLNIPIKNPEGYIFPSTYNFQCNTTAKEVVEKLSETFIRIWNEKFASKAKSEGMSMHKVLTLASIVEAETAVPEERARVAGVYYNRLRMGIRLQADPTVRYRSSNQFIDKKDLHDDNPYNTYIYEGLPPGPINSPSTSSIEAVLNPESNDYLYFVATGNGNGRHVFAKTYKDHLKNVAKYRKAVGG
jgi:UPF0755 protein